MPARRDTRIEASKVRRLSPLQTFENQSPVWGIRFHSCTWREGLTPSCQLSYKVSINLAVYPEAFASFRPTGRTERFSSSDNIAHVPYFRVFTGKAYRGGNLLGLIIPL